MIPARSVPKEFRPIVKCLERIPGVAFEKRGPHIKVLYRGKRVETLSCTPRNAANEAKKIRRLLQKRGVPIDEY